jgi:Mg2+/Co2+ transporter CorB
VRADEAGKGFIVGGNANIRALNRMMNWQLPTEGPKTLNGLILERLEAFPEIGATLMLGRYPIEILAANDNAVQTVRIEEPVAKGLAVGEN